MLLADGVSYPKGTGLTSSAVLLSVKCLAIHGLGNRTTHCPNVSHAHAAPLEIWAAGLLEGPRLPEVGVPFSRTHRI